MFALVSPAMHRYRKSSSNEISFCGVVRWERKVVFKTMTEKEKFISFDIDWTHHEAMQSQWKWIELTVAHSRIESRWEIATSLRAKPSQVRSNTLGYLKCHTRKRSIIKYEMFQRRRRRQMWEMSEASMFRSASEEEFLLMRNSVMLRNNFPSLTFDRVKHEVQWDETMTRNVHRIIMSDSRGFLIINWSLEGRFPSCWPSSFSSPPSDDVELKKGKRQRQKLNCFWKKLRLSFLLAQKSCQDYSWPTAERTTTNAWRPSPFCASMSITELLKQTERIVISPSRLLECPVPHDNRMWCMSWFEVEVLLFQNYFSAYFHTHTKSFSLHNRGERKSLRRKNVISKYFHLNQSFPQVTLLVRGLCSLKLRVGTCMEVLML